MRVLHFLSFEALMAMASAQQISRIRPEVQRRLQVNAQKRQVAYDDHTDNFLVDYSLSLLHCNGKESVIDAYGNQQYGVVILRACPTNSCSSSTQEGCTSGYSDFAVPLVDFVEAYLYDDEYLYQAESTPWDDGVDASYFYQCTAFNQTWDDDQYGNNYYIGPACTNDGSDIQLRLFKDAYCSQPVVTTTNTVSKNGASTMTLPFSEDGWIENRCLSCAEEGNDDDDDSGASNVKDMCSTLYSGESTVRCEDKWKNRHYYWDSSTEVTRYGRDTSGCQQISSLLDTSSPLKQWALSFFIVVGMLVGCCLYSAFWTCWFRYSEQEDEQGDEESANEETVEGRRLFTWGTSNGLFSRRQRTRSQQQRRVNAQRQSKGKNRSSRRASGRLGISRSSSNSMSTASLVSSEGGS